MNEFEAKLDAFIKAHGIQAEQMIFEQSCHSVDEAARAAGVTPHDLVKNICMVDDEGRLIVVIVKGEDRVSTKRVGKALGIATPRIAKPEEMLEKSGYPCGGIPSFGYDAVFLVDPRVMEMDVVYTGGGSDHSLVKISTEELVRVNGAQIARVRK